jgi:hypothetical protein
MAYDGLVLFAVVGGSGFQLVTGRGVVVYQSRDWRLFRRHLCSVPHDDDVLAPAVRVFVGAPTSDMASLGLPGRSERALARRTRANGHRSAHAPGITRVPSRCSRRRLDDSAS